jgi:hypothetical protein
MEITKKPVVKAEMLIRRPVAEVFESFAAPTLFSPRRFSNSPGLDALSRALTCALVVCESATGGRDRPQSKRPFVNTSL